MELPNYAVIIYVENSCIRFNNNSLQKACHCKKIKELYTEWFSLYHTITIVTIVTWKITLLFAIPYKKRENETHTRPKQTNVTT